MYPHLLTCSPICHDIVGTHTQVKMEMAAAAKAALPKKRKQRPQLGACPSNEVQKPKGGRQLGDKVVEINGKRRVQHRADYQPIKGPAGVPVKGEQEGKTAKIKALEADIAFLRAANESQAVQIDVMTDAMIDMKKSIDVYTAACNHKLDRARKWIRTQDSSALEYLDLENATEPEHPTPVRDLHVERMKMRKQSLQDSFQGQGKGKGLMRLSF